jgi:hypothetical protein
LHLSLHQLQLQQTATQSLLSTAAVSPSSANISLFAHQFCIIFPLFLCIHSLSQKVIRCHKKVPLPAQLNEADLLLFRKLDSGANLVIFPSAYFGLCIPNHSAT